MPSDPALTPQTLSIAEMVRVLDVASEVRRKQEVLDQQWNADEARTVLREKLQATQATTGEQLTNEQIDAAIDWYYDRLHRFQKPKPGIGLTLAHLYVRRRTIGFWLVVSAIVVAVIWWAFFSGSEQV